MNDVVLAIGTNCADAGNGDAGIGHGHLHIR
jgi:hypothetical protein